MGDHSTLTFTTLADLASARVGGRAVATNDDFFAPKANLVKPEPAVFIPGQVHLARQVDGRLGIAPPPHPRPRLVHRPAGHARRRARRQRRHQPLHRQLPVALLDRSGRCRRRRSVLRRMRSRVRRGRRCWRNRRCAATATTSLRSTIAGRGRTAAEHLSRRRRRAAARLRRGRGRLEAGRAARPRRGPRLDQERRPVS